MSNLIIDSGNTIIKIRIYDKQNIVKAENFTDWKSALRSIKNFSKNINITNCILSNVREENDEFNKFLGSNFNTVFFSHTNILPIKLKYQTPDTLGKDRLAAVCGASVLFPKQNVLIIDAGTAITYDILEKGENYLGGNISPGIQIRFKSLNAFTKKLPLINISPDDNKLYGTNTEQAIRYGVQNGVLYEINAVIEEYKHKFSELNIIFTGGDSFFFEKLLKFPIFAELNLTSIGLNKILELNV